MADRVSVGARAGSRAPMLTRVVTWRARGDRGAVTAEAAAVVPVLVAVTVALSWLVLLAATQVRVVDAAREAARVAARGETDAAAVAAGRRAAPGGTVFVVQRAGDRVTVRAAATVRGPGGLFRFLPGVEVSSEAVAAEEPQ